MKAGQRFQGIEAIELISVIYTQISHLSFLPQHAICLYSYRNASMGFSFPAFRAGYKPASKPTTVQMMIP